MSNHLVISPTALGIIFAVFSLDILVTFLIGISNLNKNWSVNHIIHTKKEVKLPLSHSQKHWSKKQSNYGWCRDDLEEVCHQQVHRNILIRYTIIEWEPLLLYNMGLLTLQNLLLWWKLFEGFQELLLPWSAVSVSSKVRVRLFSMSKAGANIDDWNWPW